MERLKEFSVPGPYKGPHAGMPPLRASPGPRVMTTLGRPAIAESRIVIESRPPVLDVVIPVHNEERDLEPCIRRLHAYLSDELTYPFRITVAENASTDRTVEVAQRLADELPGVRLLALPEAG